MEFPRLTEPQFTKLIEDFVHSIENVRRKDSTVADYQTMLLYRLEQHLKSMDSEAEVIDQYQAHEQYLLARLKKAEGITV